MNEHAMSAFEIESWEEETYDEREGVKLTRTRLTKTFRGGIEGESVAELLMAYGSEEGSAAYVGFERITGSVNDRTGSFVLHHTATSDGSRGERSSALSVAPDSATGELRGMRGEAIISVEPDGVHTFTLEYKFE